MGLASTPGCSTLLYLRGQRRAYKACFIIRGMKKGRFTTVYTIEKKLRHHVVEWSATTLSVLGAVINANKGISGFYIWSVANILWMYFGWKFKHWGLVVMNLIFLCINIYGIVSWGM